MFNLISIIIISIFFKVVWNAQAIKHGWLIIDFGSKGKTI